MALSFDYTAHSEIGLVRKNNQDSAYISPTMLMVADGMGGAAAGDLASTVAVHELRATDARLVDRLADAAAVRLGEAAAEQDADDTLRHEGALLDEDADVLAVLAGALARANDTLLELTQADASLDGMGTTVCGVLLHGDSLALVNIGDSRAYRIRDGRLTRLTHDHSWVQTLVDAGRVTEAEALEHPHRSLVMKVLNGNPAHTPDLSWTDLAAGDRLLICSDGLCGLVTDAQIEPLVGHADRDKVVADLVALAHAAGGHDNITLIVADAVEGGAPGITRVLGAAETTRVPALEHTASLPDWPQSAEGGGAAATAAVAAPRDPEQQRYGLQRRPRLVTLGLGVLVPLLLLVGGGGAWYAYTQTQFFIGAHGENVALYQGVHDPTFGLPLSHLIETDTTKLSDLSAYHAGRVRETIPVGDLATARETLLELRTKASQCLAQRAARATPSPRPTPSPSASPSAAGSASSSPTPDASASPNLPPSVGVTSAASPMPATPSEDC